MLPKIVGSGQEFAQIMIQRQDQIEAACPDNVNIARAITYMNLAIADKPALKNCSRLSMLRAVVTCVTLGLEPNGPMGHAWLIPYGNECKFQLGYQGLKELAYRSNRIDNIIAEPVFEGEAFHHIKGFIPRIDHEPRYDIDRTEHTLKFVYAYAYLKGSDRPLYVVIPKDELDTYRARSKAGNSGSWGSDPVKMYLKTGLIQVCKMTPQSADDRQLHQAISADQSGESYSMNDVVNLDDVEPMPLTPEEQEKQNQRDYDEAMKADRERENGATQ